MFVDFIVSYSWHCSFWLCIYCINFYLRQEHWHALICLGFSGLLLHILLSAAVFWLQYVGSEFACTVARNFLQRGYLSPMTASYSVGRSPVQIISAPEQDRENFMNAECGLARFFVDCKKQLKTWVIFLMLTSSTFGDHHLCHHLCRRTVNVHFFLWLDNRTSDKESSSIDLMLFGEGKR